MPQRPAHAIQDRNRNLVDPDRVDSPAFLPDEPAMALDIPVRLARTCQRLLGPNYAVGPRSAWSPNEDFSDRDDGPDRLPITGAAIGTAKGCVPQGIHATWGILDAPDWQDAYQKIYYQRGLLIKIPMNAVQHPSSDMEHEASLVAGSPTLMNCGYLIAGAGYPFERDKASQGSVPGTVRVIFTIRGTGDLAIDEPILLRTLILAHNLAIMMAAVSSAHQACSSQLGREPPVVPADCRRAFLRNGCNNLKFQIEAGVTGFHQINREDIAHRLPPRPLKTRFETSLSFVRRIESTHHKQNREFMLTAALLRFMLDLELA